MAWIRLDDDYVHHPKFVALSHGAFRLWHEGMAHCRKLMTDGLITLAYLKSFRYGQRVYVQELVVPCSPGTAPLWSLDAEGYHVHDYLDWNPSRDEDARDRESAKQRMRAYRGKRKLVTPRVTANVTVDVTPQITPPVPGQGPERSSLERELERKPFADARSRRPIFKGQRFVVFEWMLDDIRQVLGPYYEDFGLDEWFYALDERAQRLNLVMPKRDNGAWLQAQLLEEVTRRGLEIVGKTGTSFSPETVLPHAWPCSTCGDVHEGTRDQARRLVCLKAVSVSS
jgi:hypothetical protein